MSQSSMNPISGSRSVIMNPKFNSASVPVGNVHINPKFTNVHVNPNFTGRALPPVPHLNPEFLLDPSKAASYRESIHRAVEHSTKMSHLRKEEDDKTLFIDPESVKVLDKLPEKENRTPSSTFKKIGNRKLIRIRRKSKDNSVKLSSSSFKKIGSRKLIRIKSKKEEDPSPSHAQPSSKSKSSPILVYKVKKPNKIIKTTPKKKSLSLSSRFMRRTSPHAKTPFSKILNPFKLDKRRRSKVSSPLKRPSPSPVVKKSTPSPSSRRKVIGEETYLVTTTSIKKLPPPPKPARSTAPTPIRHNLITVQGVKYNVSDNGRKLHRVEDKKSSEPQPPSTNFGVSKKLFLEGEEYVEDEPGVLVRSRNSMTRQSITNYRNRSINTIIKSQTRAKQYCMFYNKFGKCNKREKGVCPYIHDPEKVAVCRKFLMGNCLNDKCLLSHEVAPEKMPSCKFFLEGLCSRDKCPYRHIKVNATAETCPEFMKGFCSKGENCKKQHTYLCQEFASTGNCSNKESCRLSHIANVVVPSSTKTPAKVKKVAPVKPKRKSLGNTPMSAQGKKARLRYYDEEEAKESKEPEPVDEDENHTSEYVIRRKRILKKVELAKQGWTGVARVEDNPIDLDDSGPYAEIDEDEPSRPPVGELPSFISLSRYESSDDEESKPAPSEPQPGIEVSEENNYEERLI